MSMHKYTFNMRAEGLPKKDCFSGKADPYLVLGIPNQIVGMHHMSPAGSSKSGQGINFSAGDGFDLATDVAQAAATGYAVSGKTAAVIFGGAAFLPVAAVIAIPFAISKVCEYAKKIHKPIVGYSEVYSSKRVKNTLTPTFKEFSMSIADSYHMNARASILIELWDWDRFGPSEYMCACLVKMSDFNDNDVSKQYQLNNDEGNPAGTLFIRVRHSDLRAPSERGEVHPAPKRAVSSSLDTALLTSQDTASASPQPRPSISLPSTPQSKRNALAGSAPRLASPPAPANSPAPAHPSPTVPAPRRVLPHHVSAPSLHHGVDPSSDDDTAPHQSLYPQLPQVGAYHPPHSPGPQNHHNQQYAPHPAQNYPYPPNTQQSQQVHSPPPNYHRQPEMYRHQYSEPNLRVHAPGHYDPHQQQQHQHSPQPHQYPPQQHQYPPQQHQYPPQQHQYPPQQHQYQPQQHQQQYQQYPPQQQHPMRAYSESYIPPVSPQDYPPSAGYYHNNQ